MSDRQAVLVRWGELFLKGDNRGRFEQALLNEVRAVVRPIAGAKVERLHGRLLVRAPGDETVQARLVEALGRVFGVSSLSPVRLVERELAAIQAAAVALVGARVERLGRISFKVESRRSDKRFPVSSPILSREVGAAVVAALALPVDVHTPALTVGVEVGFEHAFVFAETLPGAGGLPVGVTGRVELLLSGGIDSPVAGWLLLKRGCLLGATYFHSFPYTGEKVQDKVARLGALLAGWQKRPLRLAVIPFTDAQKALRAASGDGRLAVVLYRRLMLRVAEQVALEAGARALATGEALAQVASQTLENLGVIGAAATMTILRPCLAHDKQETIALAERIGSFAISIEPFDDCCSLFVPPHPETRARLERVEALERTLDLEALVASCLGGRVDLMCEPR